MYPDIVRDPEELMDEIRKGDRLRAIEARARALGWYFYKIKDEDFISFWHHYPPPDERIEMIARFPIGSKGLDAAERLLTAYETPPAPYPLERYAEALEAMANEPIRPFNFEHGLIPETPAEYAAYLSHHISYTRALRSAAEMLRMQPGPLWTVYPAYFPDPDAGEGDNDG